MQADMITKTNVRRTFRSVAAYVDFASGPSAMEGYRASRKANRNGWSGTDSFEEAVTLTSGWKEGTALIERLSATVRPQGMKARRVVSMREVGPGTLSMGAYVAGHPRPYAVLNDGNQRRPGRGRIVRIVLASATSSGITQEVINTKGAAVAALAAALEQAGRRVEIDVIFRWSGDGNLSGKQGITHIVQVKRAEQKLNLSALAFALTHTSMVRRINFSAMECEGPVIRDRVGVGRGYGYPQDADPLDRKGAIYIGKTHYNEPQWESVEGARAWITSQLKDQGVTLR